MQKFKIVDSPKTETRKIHSAKVPYGGGLAIFISFFAIVGITYLFKGVFGGNIHPNQILALFIGGLILMVGGLLDDKYNLPAKKQIWFSIAAALVVVLFHIGPSIVTNPFGGVIHIGSIGWDKYLTLADLLVFGWLMTMMYTTKFLDGLDGLVGGVITIGALMIFFLSLQTQWYQPDVAWISIIFAGAVAGFLVWNFHPAKMFLGEGGSLFTGFLIGCLAIISGGKIATTLLVMGVPILDLIRVIFRRLINHKPVYVGDNEHLHYKLLESGLSQKQAVLLIYGISFSFGITTLFLQSSQKMIALIFLFILMLLIGAWVSKK